MKRAMGKGVRSRSVCWLLFDTDAEADTVLLTIAHECHSLPSGDRDSERSPGECHARRLWPTAVCTRPSAATALGHAWAQVQSQDGHELLRVGVQQCTRTVYAEPSRPIDSVMARRKPYMYTARRKPYHGPSTARLWDRLFWSVSTLSRIL